jgi:hypothetical protein
MAVKRADGRVWIEGVEGFSPEEYASSLHGAQARILETLGESVSYDDLICYGGFGFRVEVHDKMCPSAAHPCCGFMCISNGFRALPWKMRMFEAAPLGKPKEDRAAFEAGARAAVRESIDRGIPVHYGSEEDGLIIGYGDEGRRWWCLHPYHRDGRQAFWHDEAMGFAGGSWPWGVVVWTEPKPKAERVSDSDLTTTALRQAVAMWKSEKREAYSVGDDAYARWLEWLRGVDAGTIGDPEAGMEGNGWCFAVLIHSRRIAGRWLKAKAEGFDGKAAEELRAAADHYTKIAELCMKNLKRPWDLALRPDHFHRWNTDLRQEEIARLESAREQDRKAVAAIERALEAVR